MEFRTENLFIRHWKESDYKDLYECAKDPAVARSAGWQPHRNEEESLDVIRTILNQEECYAICIDGKAVGCVELYDWKRSNMGIRENECELGCWLARRNWFRGLMHEALIPILEHGFADMHYNRIIIPIYYEAFYGHTIAKEIGFKNLAPGDLPELCSSELRPGEIYVHTPESWDEFKRKMKIDPREFVWRGPE